MAVYLVSNKPLVINKHGKITNKVTTSFVEAESGNDAMILLAPDCDKNDWPNMVAIELAVDEDSPVDDFAKLHRKCIDEKNLDYSGLGEAAIATAKYLSSHKGGLVSLFANKQIIE